MNQMFSILAREQPRHPGTRQIFEQGIKRGIVRSLINIYEARFGAMPEEIRSVIEATHDEPTLLTWLTLAGTRGVDEITAAIRASRPN
jgi:hypothetical protein